MSGEFRAEQNVEIESTDDPDIARRFGLTKYDRETGQYTAPTPPDTGERDSGELASLRSENAKLSDELAELTRQRDESAAEVEQLRAKLGERDEGQSKAKFEAPPGFTPTSAPEQPADGSASRATGRKATGGR